MTHPVRRLLPLCLLLLLATSRCSCLTATTSTGTCDGQVGDLELSGALDAESEHHTVYAGSGGATTNQTVLTLSCAQGRFKVRGTLSRVSAFGARFYLPTDAGCPPSTSDAGTSDAGTSDAGSGSCQPVDRDPDTYPVFKWEILTPSVTPVIAAGIVSATLKLDESLDGTVKLDFVDGTKLTIRYNAYHEDSLDLGSPPSSGGSGDSDSD